MNQAPTPQESAALDREREAIYREQRNMSEPTNPTEIAVIKRRGAPDVILNAGESREQGKDWTWDQLAGASQGGSHLPESVDLRKGLGRFWTTPENQGRTGSCVGQAVGTVLEWHLYKAGKMRNRHQRYSPSRRYLWQAAKEMDEWTYWPTTMLNTAGTYIKTALDVARKHGCPTDREVPMDSEGSMTPESVFNKLCENYKIKSYYAVSPWGKGYNMEGYKWWLANKGPIVTRFLVDEQFMLANRRTGVLQASNNQHPYGGHAVAVIGYDKDGNFLVKNSWGTGWGNGGYVWVSKDYAKQNFTESYGIVLD